ncbi:MAG: isoprenylcysteine carboxylmethyltransferase family protein [Gammaproteobacteria bacterium]|nr:isoprenylcysteine carboxylmethyltransferase family protein [Gammaproteobacteria bacterium]
MEEQPQTELPDHAGVAFHPPLLLALALVLGFLLRWIAPLTFLPTGLPVVIGAVIVGVSFGFFFWAVYTMVTGGASIPTSTPTDALVMRGPFRFSRNPIYLSMVLLQLGVGIWTNSLWFIVLAAASAVLLWWGVIAREERYLARKFGAEYTSYRAKVRRWL